MTHPDRGRDVSSHQSSPCPNPLSRSLRVPCQQLAAHALSGQGHQHGPKQGSAAQMAQWNCHCAPPTTTADRRSRAPPPWRRRALPGHRSPPAPSAASSRAGRCPPQGAHQQQLPAPMGHAGLGLGQQHQQGGYRHQPEHQPQGAAHLIGDQGEAAYQILHIDEGSPWGGGG